jgi:phage protein U
MVLGSWGPLVFEVSGQIVRTFSELNQDSSGRWAEHNTINTPPRKEFLGPGSDSLRMKLVFSRMLGTDPRSSYEELREKVRLGEYFPLILGGIPLSMNMWYIVSISSATTIFAPGTGDMMFSSVDVTFEEYH